MELQLYGNGGHSRVVSESSVRCGHTIINVFDDQAFKVEQSLHYQLTRSRELTSAPLVLCIGNNWYRARVADSLNLPFATIVDPSASVADCCEVADGSVVLHAANVERGAKIGRHCILNTKCLVKRGVLVEDFVHISPSSVVMEGCRILEGAHVGAKAVISKGVVVGRWAVIGAGAVITKDVPDYGRVAGAPVRSIIKRGRIKKYDIAFVGSGLSSSCAALELLKKVQSEPLKNQKLKIAIFEKHRESYRGVAYGARSGKSALTITNLKEFLPLEQREKYIQWLENNIEFILKYLANNEDKISKSWASDIEKNIKKRNWDVVFLPRALFGYYMSECLVNTLEELSNAGKIEYQLLHDEVVAITRNNHDYVVKCSSGKKEVVRKLVLGVGSAPTRNLVSSSNVDATSLVINDPFSPGLDENILKISARISKISGPAMIVVVGSNASAMEVIHHVGKLKEKTNLDNVSIATVSPSSRYPEANELIDESSNYKPVELTRLLFGARSGLYITAEDILNSARIDIKQAEANGEPIGNTFLPISTQIKELCDHLEYDQDKEFVLKYGVEIGKLQRRAGFDYMESVFRLQNNEQLRHIQGKVLGVSKIAGRIELSIDAFENNSTPTKLACDVLINCAGAEPLHEAVGNALLSNLIGSGLCAVNESGRGLKLDENFSVAENIYLLGPLMAGNKTNTHRIWHAEHCGRIFGFAEYLSNILVSDLLMDVEGSHMGMGMGMGMGNGRR